MMICQFHTDKHGLTDSKLPLQEINLIRFYPFVIDITVEILMKWIWHVNHRRWKLDFSGLRLKPQRYLYLKEHIRHSILSFCQFSFQVLRFFLMSARISKNMFEQPLIFIWLLEAFLYFCLNSDIYSRFLLQNHHLLGPCLFHMPSKS